MGGGGGGEGDGIKEGRERVGREGQKERDLERN